MNFEEIDQSFTPSFDDTQIIHGKDGKDGYTPIRGTDYWTEADKAEIIKDMADEGYIKDTDLSAHTENKNNPHNVTKAQLGLDKVDNTPDADKRVAYARDAGWAESALRAGSANNADSAMSDWDGNNIVDTYATKAELSTAVGDISTALDNIIALQNSYIGGASV